MRYKNHIILCENSATSVSLCWKHTSTETQGTPSFTGKKMIFFAFSCNVFIFPASIYKKMLYLCGTNHMCNL